MTNKSKRQEVKDRERSKMKFCMFQLQGCCKFQGTDCAFSHTTEEMHFHRKAGSNQKKTAVPADGGLLQSSSFTPKQRNRSGFVQSPPMQHLDLAPQVVPKPWAKAGWDRVTAPAAVALADSGEGVWLPMEALDEKVLDANSHSNTHSAKSVALSPPSARSPAKALDEPMFIPFFPKNVAEVDSHSAGLQPLKHPASAFQDVQPLLQKDARDSQGLDLFTLKSFRVLKALRESSLRNSVTGMLPVSSTCGMDHSDFFAAALATQAREEEIKSLTAFLRTMEMSSNCGLSPAMTLAGWNAVQHQNQQQQQKLQEMQNFVINQLQGLPRSWQPPSVFQAPPPGLEHPNSAGLNLPSQMAMMMR